MLQTIAAILAPDSCVMCRKQGNALCVDCAQTYLKPRHDSCFYCNRFGSGRTCQTCRAKTSLDGLHVAYYFEQPLDQLIYRLKYDGSKDVAKLFGPALQQNLPSLQDVQISFVPTTGSRSRARGYNQAQLLANELAAVCGTRASKLLLRVHNAEQIGQSREQRYKAVDGNFVALASRSQGRNIVIVDDVVTSGATLNECARVLKLAGASSVWGLALAKK